MNFHSLSDVLVSAVKDEIYSVSLFNSLGRLANAIKSNDIRRNVVMNCMEKPL